MVVPAALRQHETPPAAQSHGPDADNSPSTPTAAVETASGGSLAPPHVPSGVPSGGTVVLEVEQGGILVPSFLGKSVRSAIETAQENGLDLDAVGNGLAREQSPPPGSHVASGSSITVKFGR